MAASLSHSQLEKEKKEKKEKKKAKTKCDQSQPTTMAVCPVFVLLRKLRERTGRKERKEKWRWG